MYLFPTIAQRSRALTSLNTGASDTTHRLKPGGRRLLRFSWWSEVEEGAWHRGAGPQQDLGPQGRPNILGESTGVPPSDNHGIVGMRED
eukprot:SAG22_NODE_2969_length_2061_cov_1.966871_2_plen_89_part_00